MRTLHEAMLSCCVYLQAAPPPLQAPSQAADIAPPPSLASRPCSSSSAPASRALRSRLHLHQQSVPPLIYRSPLSTRAVGRPGGNNQINRGRRHSCSLTRAGPLLVRSEARAWASLPELTHSIPCFHRFRGPLCFGDARVPSACCVLRSIRLVCVLLSLGWPVFQQVRHASL